MTRNKWIIALSVLVVMVVGWGFRHTLGGWVGFANGDLHEGHDHAQEMDNIDYWTCPMHPSVKAKEAGPCPVCGMDLQPVPKATMAGMETASSQPTSPNLPGFITLTPWQQQLIGVATASVEKRSVGGDVRTVGRVGYDETQLTDVNLKITGWIRKLYVNYTGKPVKQGEPLFTLYSPELVSSQEEYLLALRTVKKLDRGGDIETTHQIKAEAISSARSLLASAKQRLLFWDISDEQIEALAKRGKPQTTVIIYAPASGFVINKMAVEGMFVQPGMRLYQIASLNNVWVYADVYEYELPTVREGQKAMMSLAYQPERIFEGLVDYVYPSLDPKTRTAKIRLIVPNPQLELRPEMYVDVVLETNRKERLTVPESAVLFSGKRRIVFVALGEGRFQPRVVRLGTLMGDHYEVLAGVKGGDRVVTSANFLLDSESRLKNVMADMSADNLQEEE